MTVRARPVENLSQVASGAIFAAALSAVGVYLPWFHHRSEGTFPVVLLPKADGFKPPAELADGRLVLILAVVAALLGVATLFVRAAPVLALSVGIVVAVCGGYLGAVGVRNVSDALDRSSVAVGPGLVLVLLGALLVISAGVREASLAVRSLRGRSRAGFGFAKVDPAEIVTPVNAPPKVAAWVWSPTHLVPAGGVSAWPQPDASQGTPIRLTVGLPLMMVERRGEWARIRASNGWEGWVDARRLTVGTG